MHVRYSTRHSGGKTYRYVQLVQSYRRPDGMPAHRVVANLGALSELEVQNLKAALAASRQGRPVVLPDLGTARSRRTPVVLANLKYLPLAVLGQVWDGDGLAGLVQECLAEHGGDEETAQVVEALVLQRCVDPDSKLASVAWFRRTALPELMGFELSRYNNTRVHRVLEVLDAAEGRLQERLPGKLQARCGSFISLFGDVTDTWFEGHGPELARPGRDKEGIYRRRIGVALLCDQRGFPLRWKTLPGDYRDDRALTEMAKGLARESWARDLPVVMDRSMGRASRVAFLAGTGLRFLTAMPVDEFATSGAGIPWQPFAKLEPAGTEESLGDDLAAAAQVAAAAGMTQVRKDRWVLDLGIFEKEISSSADGAAVVRQSRAVAAVRHARSIASGGASTTELSAENGLSKRSIQRYRHLCGLVEQLQARVLAGEADALTVQDLLDVARLPAGAQPSAFEAALASRTKKLTVKRNHPDAEPHRVRGVVHFNPERFVEQRRTAAAQCRELEDLVTRMNDRLADSGCRVTDKGALRDVEDFLKRNKLRDTFQAEVHRLPDGGRRIGLHRDTDAWARHRRYHGFNLLVAHPDLPQSAEEIVALYFAKDMVEKDFQAIKSALAIRPVRHRTDLKVRAHVSLCVLALLLGRLLEHRLRQARRNRTFKSALDLLESCHLNLTDRDGTSFYTVTAPTEDQRDLLAALNLQPLTDDLKVGQQITPR